MLAAIAGTFLAASLASAQVFLSEERAAEVVLKDCDAVEREEKTLSPADRAALEKLAGLRFPIPRYTLLRCASGGEVLRYAVIMDEIGKSEPITFLVGVERDGKAGEVALMIFRESRGAEVRQGRFTRQFMGKKLDDPVRVNQDVVCWAGATLSSEAMARAVKKALALVHHYYLKK